MVGNNCLYLHVTLKIRQGKMHQFCELMPRMVSEAERHGWKLLAAWSNIVGRLNVVVDLWEIADANSIPKQFSHLLALADWPQLEQRLAECVEDEVLQVMGRLPYDLGRI
jgi:NIPSNAP